MQTVKLPLDGGEKPVSNTVSHLRLQRSDKINSSGKSTENLQKYSTEIDQDHWIFSK